MKKILLIIAAAGLLFGCAKSGQGRRPVAGNKNFSPVFLFEVDGVRVYRFYDAGNYIYFTNTTGRVSYTETVSAGKAGTRTYTVETLCNNGNR